MSEEASARYWVTVHGEKHGPYFDRDSADAAAKELERQNPNKRVTVVDSRGWTID